MESFSNDVLNAQNKICRITKKVNEVEIVIKLFFSKCPDARLGATII